MAEKEVIRRLEAHILRLIDDHREAIRQRDEALAGRDALKTQIRTLQERIHALDAELARVELSEGLAGKSPDREKAKARVNRLMREVDKCIALLRQAAPQTDEPHGKGGQTERDFDTDKDNG